MAMRHRKLYPITNKTVDCQDICDPSCPYGCFPDPEYYFIPPPPPAAALPSTSRSGFHLSPYVIVLITFTATFFLIIGYYAIVVKRCWRRRHRLAPPRGGEGFLDENRGPIIDNPIWYITTVGLQPSVIDSITVVKYSKGGGLIDGTDCSVCLNEFQEDETLRLLPKCNHAFHIMCIDTWLRSHTNCPMCRCGILSNTESNSHCGISSNTLNAAPSESIDNNNPRDLDSNQATQMEIPQPDEELIINETQDEIETREIEDETKDSGFRVVDIFAEHETEDQTQTRRIKRSFSMNFPSNIHHLTVECEGSPVNSRLFRVTSESSISKSLHKRPVPMKRSFSYNGRSLLSRHYRNHKVMIRLRNFC